MTKKKFYLVRQWRQNFQQKRSSEVQITAFAVFVLALHIGKHCHLTIKRLSYTFAELCEMLYASTEKHTPRFIVRLHSVTFCHVIAVR